MPALKPSVRGFNHPIVSAKPAKENVRPPVKMVSIAPLLKRKPMKELYVPKYKLKKSRPEHPLYVEYKGLPHPN